MSLFRILEKYYIDHPEGVVLEIDSRIIDATKHTYFLGISVYDTHNSRLGEIRLYSNGDVDDKTRQLV